MAAEYWWRSWHGAPMDHKYSVIAAKSGVKTGIASAVMWALLDYASQHKERGTVDGFDVESYSVYSGFSENEVNAVIKALTDKKMIVEGRLANWEKRQPKSEKEIQRAIENRAKAKLLQNVTECYTDTDTDAKTESETELIRQADEIQRLIEKMTGYPATQGDLMAINEMAAMGITRSDISGALAFFKDNNKVARGAANLLKSVQFQAAKRIQSNNNGQLPPRRKKIIQDDNGNLIEVDING